MLPAPTRLSAPVPLPRATEYSDDPALNSPLTLISRVKGLGYRYTQFRDAVRIDHDWGPKRGPGDLELPSTSPVPHPPSGATPRHLRRAHQE
jgi:hypothetical protein